MQLTLLDIITDIEGTKFCCVCGQPIETNGDLCHKKECGDYWWYIYVESVWQIKKND